MYLTYLTYLISYLNQINEIHFILCSSRISIITYYYYIFIVLYFYVVFQDPPIVELRFGNRMMDTGHIGPGDDVYFECAARANPSTTIRYSWYHNVSNRSYWCLFELYNTISQ